MSVTQETLETSELINWTIFQELLLMDEDEEGFALSLVETFVQQANETFIKIEELINSNNTNDETLEKLSQLGHYLKGSAAALGLRKVQEQCERIQNYGKKDSFDNNEIANNARNNNDWIKCVNEAYRETRINFDKSKLLLSQYFQSEL